MSAGSGDATDASSTGWAQPTATATLSVIAGGRRRCQGTQEQLEDALGQVAHAHQQVAGIPASGGAEVGAARRAG
ncbi:MAG: hypothetical protein HS111_31130 [Kofleriaceae bacterium]|nr:hypothetical protein [Kofleriaceae bacterium]